MGIVNGFDPNFNPVAIEAMNQGRMVSVSYTN